MLDIKLIRERADYVKAELSRAGVNGTEIDAIIACDAERRRLQFELDELRARRTRESKELGRLAPEAREVRRAEMRELGERITAGERRMAEIEQRLTDLMLSVRNLPRPYVPTGSSEADNRVVRQEGEPAKLDFQPLPHWEIGERLGIIDFERGVKLSGSRFYVLKGAGAALERALINWMVNLHRRQGYTEVYVPFVVKEQCLVASGQLPKFYENLYHDVEDDVWLVPTAEVPITSL